MILSHSRCWFILAGVIALARLAPAQATPAQSEPVLEVQKIVDHRAGQLHKTNLISQLGLTLSMRSTVTTRPSGYGSWHLERVVDDLGTDLTPPPPSTQPMPSTPEEIEKLFANATDEVASNEAFTSLDPASEFATIDLNLGRPKRAATRIATLRGDVTLFTGGELKTVTIDRPTRFYDKPLDDPALRAAGLTLTLLKSDADSNKLAQAGPNLPLRCAGDIKALAQPTPIEVLDSSGKSVHAGFSFAPSLSSTNDDANIALQRPLDDSMTIVIKVFVGRQTQVVKFDLHDLPLP